MYFILFLFFLYAFQSYNNTTLVYTFFSPKPLLGVIVTTTHYRAGGYRLFQYVTMGTMIMIYEYTKTVLLAYKRPMSGGLRDFISVLFCFFTITLFNSIHLYFMYLTIYIYLYLFSYPPAHVSAGRLGHSADNNDRDSNL